MQNVENLSQSTIHMKLTTKTVKIGITALKIVSFFMQAVMLEKVGSKQQQELKRLNLKGKNQVLLRLIRLILRNFLDNYCTLLK